MMRRFSRSSSMRKSQRQSQSPTSYPSPDSNAMTGPSAGVGYSSQQQYQQQQHQQQPISVTRGGGGGGSLRDRALGGDYTVLPSGGRMSNEGRPVSSATDASFDFANRPVTASTNVGSGPATGGVGGLGGLTSNPTGPSSMNRPQSLAGGALSRTDQVVLRYFWESKYQENVKRDLHYLKFPFFPEHPSHRDLLPYCEIYHLIKTSPGANIISLGSASGVYIGFELQTGSQLHIDLDDDWFIPTPTNTTNTTRPTSDTSITHNRVTFRSFSSLLSDPSGPATFSKWPKPLTIEFLEEQYLAWCRDLMSICWESKEIRELGPSGNGHGNGNGSGNAAASAGSMGGYGNGSAAVGSGKAAGQPAAVGGGMMHHQSLSGTGGSESHQDAASIGDDEYASERSTEHGI